MIKVRLVGASEDLDGLVLSTKPRGKRGSHVLPVDERLFRVLEQVVRERHARDRVESRRRAPEPEERRETRIPPRDIQRLLRAGRSPEQVAKDAGVDVAYVEQFYTPVLYERDGVIRDAHASYLHKPRLGQSHLPLGAAVAHNLAARHVHLSDEDLADRWTATRVDGQPWTLGLAFSFRGRQRRATWRYHPQTRELQAVNAVAADLGWVSAGPRARAGREQGAAAAAPGPARDNGRAAARSTARPPARATARKAARTPKVAARTPKAAARTPKAAAPKRSRKAAARPRATSRAAGRAAAPRTAARRKPARPAASSRQAPRATAGRRARPSAGSSRGARAGASRRAAPRTRRASR